MSVHDFAALGLPDPLPGVDGAVWVLPDGPEVELWVDNFRVDDLHSVHLSPEQTATVALALLDQVLTDADRLLVHAAVNATGWRAASNAEALADAAADAAAWRDDGDDPR